MLENLKPAARVDIPAEFRAAIEFDGEQGSATLPANETNWEQFLIEQGFDPSEYEIVGNPRTSRWQKYDGDWLTSYRFNFRKINPQVELELAWKNAKANKRKPAVTNTDTTIVVMLADFQLGKTDSRGGIEEQLQRIFESYDRLEAQLKRGKYSKVILADMGDIVEGFSNKADMQQTFTNNLSLMNQVDAAVTLIWDVVKRAAKYCDDIVYATVASNHCQFRLNKQQVGAPGRDDWGTFVAKQIERLSQHTGLGVSVLVPEPSDESLALDVFGDQFHVLGLWHGHQANRPEGIPSWWEKQAFGTQPVAAASIGLTGHFHHLRVQELGLHPNGGSRYWIQGKTMDNGSGWFRLNQGQDSQPGLTAFELHKGKHFTGSVITL